MFGRSQTARANNLNVNVPSQISEEESKVYNLQDLDSMSGNNNLTLPNEPVRYRSVSVEPTVIDQRRSGLNITSEENAGEIIHEQLQQ